MNIFQKEYKGIALRDRQDVLVRLIESKSRFGEGVMLLINSRIVRNSMATTQHSGRHRDILVECMALSRYIAHQTFSTFFASK